MDRKVHEMATIAMKTKTIEMKTKSVACEGLRFFFFIGSNIYERSV